MPLRLVEEWLHSCSGCEIALLNMGEGLLELLPGLEIVHMPILMDHKYVSSQGEDGAEPQLSLPRAEVGLVSGGCANEEHRELLEEIRAKCDFLVAMGTCATHGGIPALTNTRGLEQTYAEVFAAADHGQAAVPDQGVPRPLDRVYAVDELVRVDLLVPGCPPNPVHLKEVLTALVEGRAPQLPTKSVCDTCPAIRRGTIEKKEVQRFTVNADYDPAQELSAMRCLLEQGLMCMGPVTAAGCARRGAPSCIQARVPCRGCYGPVRNQGNQMMDMMNALVSGGVDMKTIVDRQGLLRFSGAHNRLRKRARRRG